MSITLEAVPNASDSLFSGRVDIASARYSIGRAAENDWVISDPKRMISKRHCVIERRPDGYRIVDTSTNGVALNGKPVDRNGGSMLHDGDEIELGQYRFKIRMAQQASVSVDDPAKPNITAILHDLAPAGVSASGKLPGMQDDILARPADRKPAAPPRPLDEMGWNGPPLQQADVVKPSDAVMPRDREFINRSEQAQTDRLRIDLPRPKQIIPDDWYLAPETAQTPPATSTEPLPPIAAPAEPIVAEPARLDGPQVTIIPVQNIDLDGPQPVAQPPLAAPVVVQQPIPVQTAPAPAPVFTTQPARQDDTLFQAFCDGAGIAAAELSRADLVRLFHNAGRALAVTAAELQNLQIAKTRSTTLLEGNEPGLGQTPWIYSLSGEDRTNVVRAVIGFLAEAEPRDLEMMRTDFIEVRSGLEGTAEGVIAFVESLQRALSLQVLEKNVSSTSRMVPALRRAAAWDALIEQSGLFESKGGKTENVDLLKLLHRELKKGRDK